MYDVYVTECELYYYEFNIFYIYNVNNIPMLNGTNFKKWKEHVVIVLRCMDLDYVLREDRPPDLTSASTTKQMVVMEKWE